MKLPKENQKCNDPTCLKSNRGVQSLRVDVAPANTADNLWCSRPQSCPTSPPSINQALQSITHTHIRISNSEYGM